MSEPIKHSTLLRYGVQWNGPREPICTPMPDGYWTPWHLADARIEFDAKVQKALRGDVHRLKTEMNALRHAYEERIRLCVEEGKSDAAALRKRDEQIAELVGALNGIMGPNPDRPSQFRGEQPPGHAHSNFGIWDDDNSILRRGRPCLWCAAWDEARAILARRKAASRG